MSALSCLVHQGKLQLIKITMKHLLALLLALCTVPSVQSANEVPCDASNCLCDMAKYNESGLPPPATIECLSGQQNIYISKCQLKKNKYDTSNLALNNNNAAECNSFERSVNNEPQIVFHNPLTVGKCGNIVEINSTHVTFSNILHIYAAPSTLITRNNATLNISCTYPLNYMVSLNTTLKPKQTITQITVPGVMGALTVVMALYRDESFTQVVTDANTELTIESDVYVSVNIPALEANTFSIKVIRIYASAQQTGGEIFNLTIGQEGCPDPSLGANLISVIRNGNGTEARFKVKVFQIANNDLVYLFADVTICPSECLAKCNAKSGETSSLENVATLQMELSATAYDNTADTATNSVFKTSASMLLILSLLFVKFM